MRKRASPLAETRETRRRTTKAILMFKVLKDYVGPTLKESLIRRNHMQTNYDLRNSHTDLALPKPKREFLKKSFKYSGAKLWNSLSIYRYETGRINAPVQKPFKT